MIFNDEGCYRSGSTTELWKLFTQTMLESAVPVPIILSSATPMSSHAKNLEAFIFTAAGSSPAGDVFKSKARARISDSVYITTHQSKAFNSNGEEDVAFRGRVERNKRAKHETFGAIMHRETNQERPPVPIERLECPITTDASHYMLQLASETETELSEKLVRRISAWE